MPCTFKQSVMSWLQEFDMPPMTIHRSGLFENQPQMTLKVDNSPG